MKFSSLAVAPLSRDYPPSSGEGLLRCKMLSKTLFFAIVITGFSIVPPACAGPAAAGVMLPDTELIDQPTAGILDYYGFLAKTRFFYNGGVLGWLRFGVLQRLNLGASMQADRLIGTESSIRFVRPEIQVKFRFYDGGQYIPALAIGYDGQGYFYDKGRKKYQEKGRGVYVAGSQEVFVPGLLVHPGFNVSDFDSSSVFGFIGVNYTVEEKISLMAEWDNINRIKDSRFNCGMRIYVTPFFHLDLAVREIASRGHLKNGLARKPERIVQLRYNSNF